ncbi:unnamed protein product [Larinioides sclopetarius]|uniref:RNase H type-1 domain-containing protein n=1 Tax=Larinioides sclopetarius TaxID=280406 RepID=A0AAV2A0W1_9ARAC
MDSLTTVTHKSPSVILELHRILLSILNHSLSITLIWVPGHRGIAPSETADRLTKSVNEDTEKWLQIVAVEDLIVTIKHNYFDKEEICWKTNYSPDIRPPTRGKPLCGSSSHSQHRCPGSGQQQKPANDIIAKSSQNCFQLLWEASRSSEQHLEGMDEQRGVSLPSEMTEDEYIYLPSDKEDFEEVTYRIGGKWMVYTMSLDQQDKFWQAFLPLYHQGLILGLKASSAKETKAQSEKAKEGYVIMCYTDDSDDKKCVKNTADSIRAAIGIREIMYYKSNAASIDGLYNHEGHKSVSKYMHTYKGQLFEREKFNRWKIVSFDDM